MERSSQRRVRMLLHSPDCQRQARERFPRTARIEPFYLVSVPALAFRLLPYGLSVTSRSIREALANDTLDRPLSAFDVVNPEPHAVAVAEIELGKISVQVLLFAMLIDALHTALEDR